MKSRKRIKKIDILVILAIGIILLDIPYLYHITNPRFAKIGLSSITIISELLYMRRQKIKLRLEHWMLLSASTIIIVNTLIYNGAIYSCLSDLSTILIVCSLIIISKEKQQIIRMCKLWCYIFFVLIIADTFTMIMWPNGLYVGTYVRNNWLLGYKTVRLTYTFTLLLFYNYAEIQDKGKITWHSYLIATIVLGNTILSNSTGALVAVLTYELVLFFAFGRKKTKLGRSVQQHLLGIISHHYVILLIWVMCYVLFVVFYRTSFVQNIIVQMDKEYSFGQRTLIWINTITTIREHWLFGIGMMTREEVLQSTGGFTNAHNTVFTYLQAGGIIVLIMFSVMVFSALKNTTKNKANYMVTIYIYCILYLGIISSSMAFNPFFFGALLLPLKQFDNSTMMEMSYQKLMKKIEGLLRPRSFDN